MEKCQGKSGKSLKSEKNDGKILGKRLAKCLGKSMEKSQMSSDYCQTLLCKTIFGFFGKQIFYLHRF